LELSINIVEFVLNFPTNLKSTQSEFGWRNYGQIQSVRDIILKVRSAILKITVSNSRTHFLPVLFRLVPKITDRNSKIMDRNYWWLEHEFVFLKWLFIEIKNFLHPFIPNVKVPSENRPLALRKWGTWRKWTIWTRNENRIRNRLGS
jgi:hypothetical protein